jgi:Zn finger protein HypA/HybF involved in hydrogenase expression
MHTDIVPNALNLQHGRGGIWCLDCHHPTKRNKLFDNFGRLIDFNQPQKLCGKCHGPVYRDWREGIHGKRIGEWASNGKKRWFVCTECHNPHNVQQGKRNAGFRQLKPEPAPKLPKGLKNTNHERHGH